MIASENSLPILNHLCHCGTYFFLNHIVCNTCLWHFIPKHATIWKIKVRTPKVRVQYGCVAIKTSGACCQTTMLLSTNALSWYFFKRFSKLVHSVVISRRDVILNETSPTSARYIKALTRADPNSIERMRWAPPLDMIDILFAFAFCV